MNCEACHSKPVAYDIQKIPADKEHRCPSFKLLCEDCNMIDRWDWLNWMYRIEIRIPQQTTTVQHETNVRYHTYVNSDNVQDLSDKDTIIHKTGSVYFIYDREDEE